MKALMIECRIDEVNQKIGTVLKHEGFGVEENIESLLVTMALLDNIKSHIQNKLNTISQRVK
jgi:hypothetical protein